MAGDRPGQQRVAQAFLPLGGGLRHGLFFLLVGYFTPRSYDRKGPRFIVLFRRVFCRTNRVLVAMAAARYAAYIIHFMIVVFLQAGIEGLNLPALIKFGIVAIFGAVLAFGIGYLSRRVPGLRVVLGTTPSKADGRSGKPNQHVSPSG